MCTGWNFGEGQDRRRLPVLAAGRPRRDRLRDRAEHPHSGNNLRLRVRLYRKHVNHETRRNFQLDLFTPDDGHYEYSAVATNLPLGLSALWAFACGRGAQEKTFAELKGEFALDVVPTKHYAANSALYFLRPRESNSLLRRAEYGRRG